MKNEGPIQNILQAIIPAMEITNSIFNTEKYRSEDNFHPKLKILTSATLKLQQNLRKALFSCLFTPQDSSVILEFFEYKSKVDKKDEFVVQSYQRAVSTSQIYEYAWKFRLNMSDSEDLEITSASEFNNLLEILTKILQCLELCLDFPFESKNIQLIKNIE